MGSLPQQNTPTESFADFYRDSRLMPLYKQAAERGVMHANAAFDKLCNGLEEIIPAENPPLVTWRSSVRNVLFDTNGTPVLMIRRWPIRTVKCEHCHDYDVRWIRSELL